MKAESLKIGDEVIIVGRLVRVDAIESTTTPDYVLIRARTSDKTESIIRLHKSDQVMLATPASERVNLDAEAISEMITSKVNSQLEKGRITYGKSYIPHSHDVINAAIEEMIDALVYLYVLKERSK